MARLVLPMLENFSHCLCAATKASLSQAHAHILKNGISLPETIQIFSKLDHFGHVIRVFSYMLTQGIVPDSRVFPTVIKTCAALSALQTGKQMHCFALVSGFGLDSVVLSSLLHMYVQFDRLKDARNVFDRLPQPGVVTSSALISRFARKGRVKETMELFHQTRHLGVELNLVSWNGMISGFNRSGSYLDAVLMFRNMHLEGLKPDGTSVSSVLPAVGDLEMPFMGIQIHCYVIKQGLGPDKFVVSALIDMYGKCACASEMSGVFDEMDEVDVGACNALVTGLSRNGLVDNALEVFRQFKGMDLNVVSWTSMIASCSQNGKDIKALELFREMQTEGIKPNSVTIPCLLPACGNIAALLHGKAAHCFSLRNGIFNDNKVHMLLAGDSSHPQMPQIIEKLAKLTVEMKKSGYVPHTDFVLQDVEEQDKEQILCGHSEKLAVVLGLLNTKPGFPLQVEFVLVEIIGEQVKRVCGFAAMILLDNTEDYFEVLELQEKEGTSGHLAEAEIGARHHNFPPNQSDLDWAKWLGDF
ncbi:hypothetical protein OIU78_012833 [Salix suchowensis]|nr:hypothetical protein OIU78_012833 [Salix suchowensis]